MTTRTAKLWGIVRAREGNVETLNESVGEKRERERERERT